MFFSQKSSIFVLEMQGIVLHIEHKTDKTTLLYAYTREKGRQVFAVYGAGGRKKRLADLTPMSIVEITVQPSAKDIAVLQEVRLVYVPTRIPFEVKRKVVAMYIAEALTKVLRYELSDEPLYQYLIAVAQDIDQTEDIASLASEFTTNLSIMLGYGGEPIEELRELRSNELLSLL